MVYVDQILHTYKFRLGTGMKNGINASPSISPTGRSQLVKCPLLLSQMVYFDQILLVRDNFLYFCPFLVWCPVSGVVLDCIDS